MKIAFLGPVSMEELAARIRFDKAPLKCETEFSLGSDIVRKLVERGHEVYVISNNKAVRDAQKFTSPKCEVWLVPARKRVRYTFLALFSKEVALLRNAVREIKPDVVFAQWVYHNAYAGLTSGYPCLVVAHDSPWSVFKAFRNLQFLIKALYATLFVVPRIRSMTAVSPYIEAEFRKFSRLKDADITIVPNGIELDNNSPSPIVNTSGRIVMVTEWGRLKNSKTMLLAWRIVHGRHPEWKLTVFGKYMDKNGAEIWMRTNGLGDLLNGGAIELRGFATHDAIRQELKSADLFVSPSLEESFGMVFVEAMSQGVPCIGGDKSGAVPWVMGDGGVVCDVTKPDKLAECIERVMGDNALRKRLSEGGVQRVRKMFNIERIVDMYETKLQSLAGGR